MDSSVRTTAETNNTVSPRRLCIVTLDFRPQIGGVQEYLYEIARRLGRRIKVIVLTTTAGRLPDNMPFERILLPSASPLAITRFTHMCRPDKVLVGHAHPRLLLAAAFVARDHYGCITYGNDYLAAQNRWHRLVFNKLLARAQPLITISRSNSRRLRNMGFINPIVVRPGTDPVRFSPMKSVISGPLTLLTVGRLVPRKGIDTVLRTLPGLLKKFPELRYHVAGDGPDRSHLEQLVCDLEVSHAVEFMGNVSGEELPTVYREANVFVMPTREVAKAGSVEGFGIVYLEASASGLPVIAARSGGAAEAVRDGVTGFLVPPDDPEVLTATLEKLLNNPELRRRLGQAGRQWVESEMNWDRTADQMQRALAISDAR